MNLHKFALELPSTKIDWNTYFITQALTLSARSDCTRRRFGAVIVDQNNRLLSAGYNGPPTSIQSACQKWQNENNSQEAAPPEACFKVKAGNMQQNSGYDACVSIHAEQNAILDYGIRQLATIRPTLYIAGRNGQTGELIDSHPCIHCSRMIRQAGIKKIYYLKENGEIQSIDSKELHITNWGSK